MLSGHDFWAGRFGQGVWMGSPLRFGLLQAWRCRGQPPRLRGHASPGHIVPLQAEFTKFSDNWDRPQIGVAWWKQNHPSIVRTRAGVEVSKIGDEYRNRSGLLIGIVCELERLDCKFSTLELFISQATYLSISLSICRRWRKPTTTQCNLPPLIIT